MKAIYLSLVAIFLSISINAQDEISAIAPVSEQGNNLELAAVLDLFKDSKDLEDFERQLNSEKVGINNLDLNNDNQIDYIRVVETTDGNYKVIILQAVLGENQFQDVATINIEKVSDEEINVQCQGDEEIYGKNYYVQPEPKVHVHVHLWPIWGVMYAPHYVYYRSPYYWHYYPTYWNPYRPVPYTTYMGRPVIVSNRGVYYHSHKAVVHRPPVYHRTYSSRAVVKPNTRNNYNRSSSGNNSSRNPNSGKTDTRKPNNSNTGNRSTNSTRQNSNGTTNQRTNSSSQHKSNSSSHRSNSSSNQRGRSTAQPRNKSSHSSGAKSQRSGSSSKRSGTSSSKSGGRSGGRR